MVLARRRGEIVTIGNDVTVTVLGVHGDEVRLGIKAPKNVGVHREEVAERIKAENQGRVPGADVQTSKEVTHS